MTQKGDPYIKLFSRDLPRLE